MDPFRRHHLRREGLRSRDIVPLDLIINPLQDKILQKSLQKRGKNIVDNEFSKPKEFLLLQKPKTGLVVLVLRVASAK